MPAGHPDKRIFVARTDGDCTVSCCEATAGNGVPGSSRSVPTGDHILSASEDGTARIWSAVTGTLERTLRGHSEAVGLGRHTA